MNLNIKRILLFLLGNVLAMGLLIAYFGWHLNKEISGDEMGLWFLVGFSLSLFALVGITMFSTGWKSYEAKYVKGAEETLESMFLTIPPQHLLYLSFLVAVILAGLFGALVGDFVVGGILGSVGFLFPKLFLHLAKAKRDELFKVQLVDAITSMTNSLRAGFTLAQSFDLIEREMANPIGQEFRLVNYEMRIGVPLEQALKHLYERMPSEDLDLVVTAITISQQIGGGLTEVFENIARTIRDRRVIDGKITALTAQGKLQGMVMCCLPLALAVIINFITPDLMRPLYTTGPGYVLIGVVIVLEIIGALVIRKIVSIEV